MTYCDDGLCGLEPPKEGESCSGSKEETEEPKVLQYEYEEKVSLITDLWGIAYSDGKLDKYEDYVIRKFQSEFVDFLEPNLLLH